MWSAKHQRRGHHEQVLASDGDVAVALRHADRGYVLETGRIVLAAEARALLGSACVRRAYLGLGVDRST